MFCQALRALVVIAFFGFSLPSFSNENKVGIWWYEDPEPENEAEIEEHPAPPLPALGEMMEMHPDTLEKLLEEHRDYAVYKLTPEATTNYYVVQDAVRRKSRAFTALSSFVMLQNPELNARGAYPVNNPGRNAQKQVNQQAMTRKIAGNRKNYALVFLTSKTCPYCKVQEKILKYFSDRYQWAIKPVDIEQAPEAALRFNAQVTPMTVLIERGSQKWMPVTVGVESLSIIEQNTYRAIRLMRQEIEPSQFFTNEQQQGGFFDPSI